MHLDQLKFCVVCANGPGYVYVCKCYVVLDESDEAPLFVFPVSAYGGVVCVVFLVMW